MASTVSSTLHQALVDEIGRAIVVGEHPPGRRMLTTEFAADRGVSRSAAREAVRVLESLGLVDVRRKAGVVVRPRAEWNVYAPEVIGWRLGGAERDEQLREITELRSAVEPLAARLAARRASPEQRAELVDLARRLADEAHEAGGESYLDVDTRFHRLLLESSGNRMLAALADTIEAMLHGRTAHRLMPEVAVDAAISGHRDVADAVLRGDGDGAAAAMGDIVSEAGESLRRSDV